jgi:putative acetyltransferase
MFVLSIDDLCAPTITFFVATLNGTASGCIALASKDGYGEVKSMFTGPSARGRGVAAAILRALEDHAREIGLPILRLETATILDGAVRLYERHGFTRCTRFGDYVANDVSVYMEKTL